MSEHRPEQDPPTRLERERELRRLAPIASWLADRYYLPAADRDDVRQIASLAIWEALERWDGRCDAAPLAWVVARRRLASELRAAGFDRREANRHTIATTTDADGAELAIVDLLPSAVDLEQLLEARAELRAIVDALPSLTPLERATVGKIMRGESYSARRDDRGKSEDNAAQRARRKLHAAARAAVAA